MQPGTEVSTDIAGWPFRFSPEPGWDTQEKTLPEHMLYFLAAGNCRAMVGGRRLSLGTGDLCWVSPGVVFRFFIGANEPSPVVQRFRLRVSSRGRPMRLQWDHRLFPDVAEALEWARALVAEPQQGGKYSSRRRASLAALFSMSVFESSQRSRREVGLSQQLRRRLSRYALEHAEERITPADLARLAGLTPDYFSRIFRKSLGLPPREWILRQRLRYAAGLLAEPEWRVSEVATRLGYPDIYLFSRQFKKEFGLSPRRWRDSYSTGRA